MKVKVILVVESAYDIDLEVPDGTSNEFIEAKAVDEFNNNAWKYGQTSSDVLYSEVRVENIQSKENQR